MNSKDFKELRETFSELNEKIKTMNNLGEVAYITFATDEQPRPPRGLRPKWLAQEQRADEIQEAISRYNEVKKRVPLHWIEEYNDICKELEENESDKLGVCEYMTTENNENIKL